MSYPTNPRRSFYSAGKEYQNDDHPRRRHFKRDYSSFTTSQSSYPDVQNEPQSTRPHFRSNPDLTQFRNSLHGHTDAIHSAAFSANGDFLITGSKDNTAALWHATADPDRPLRCFDVLKHSSRVFQCFLSDNAGRVVTACSDGVVRVWSRRNASESTECIKICREDFRNARACQISSDGNFVVATFFAGNRLPLSRTDSNYISSFTSCVVLEDVALQRSLFEHHFSGRVDQCRMSSTGSVIAIGLSGVNPSETIAKGCSIILLDQKGVHRQTFRNLFLNDNVCMKWDLAESGSRLAVIGEASRAIEVYEDGTSCKWNDPPIILSTQDASKYSSCRFTERGKYVLTIVGVTSAHWKAVRVFSVRKRAVLYDIPFAIKNCLPLCIEPRMYLVSTAYGECEQIRMVCRDLGDVEKRTVNLVTSKYPTQPPAIRSRRSSDKNGLDQELQHVTYRPPHDHGYLTGRNLTSTGYNSAYRPASGSNCGPSYYHHHRELLPRPDEPISHSMPPSQRVSGHRSSNVYDNGVNTGNGNAVLESTSMPGSAGLNMVPMHQRREEKSRHSHPVGIDRCRDEKYYDGINNIPRSIHRDPRINAKRKLHANRDALAQRNQRASVSSCQNRSNPEIDCNISPPRITQNQAPKSTSIMRKVPKPYVKAPEEPEANGSQRKAPRKQSVAHLTSTASKPVKSILRKFPANFVNAPEGTASNGSSLKALSNPSVSVTQIKSVAGRTAKKADEEAPSRPSKRRKRVLFDIDNAGSAAALPMPRSVQVGSVPPFPYDKDSEFLPTRYAKSTSLKTPPSVAIANVAANSMPNYKNQEEGCTIVCNVTSASSMASNFDNGTGKRKNNVSSVSKRNIFDDGTSISKHSAKTGKVDMSAKKNKTSAENDIISGDDATIPQNKAKKREKISVSGDDAAIPQSETREGKKVSVSGDDAVEAKQKTKNAEKSSNSDNNATECKQIMENRERSTCSGEHAAKAKRTCSSRENSTLVHDDMVRSNGTMRSTGNDVPKSKKKMKNSEQINTSDSDPANCKHKIEAAEKINNSGGGTAECKPKMANTGIIRLSGGDAAKAKETTSSAEIANIPEDDAVESKKSASDTRKSIASDSGSTKSKRVRTRIPSPPKHTVSKKQSVKTGRPVRKSSSGGFKSVSLPMAISAPKEVGTPENPAVIIMEHSVVPVRESPFGSGEATTTCNGDGSHEPQSSRAIAPSNQAIMPRTEMANEHLSVQQFRPEAVTVKQGKESWSSQTREVRNTITRSALSPRASNELQAHGGSSNVIISCDRGASRDTTSQPVVDGKTIDTPVPADTRVALDPLIGILGDNYAQFLVHIPLMDVPPPKEGDGESLDVQFAAEDYPDQNIPIVQLRAKRTVKRGRPRKAGKSSRTDPLKVSPSRPRRKSSARACSSARSSVTGLQPTTATDHENRKSIIGHVHDTHVRALNSGVDANIKEIGKSDLGCRSTSGEDHGERTESAIEPPSNYAARGNIEIPTTIDEARSDSTKAKCTDHCKNAGHTIKETCMSNTTVQEGKGSYHGKTTTTINEALNTSTKQTREHPSIHAVRGNNKSVIQGKSVDAITDQGLSLIGAPGLLGYRENGAAVGSTNVDSQPIQTEDVFSMLQRKARLAFDRTADRVSNSGEQYITGTRAFATICELLKSSLAYVEEKEVAATVYGKTFADNICTEPLFVQAFCELYQESQEKRRPVLQKLFTEALCNGDQRDEDQPDGDQQLLALHARDLLKRAFAVTDDKPHPYWSDSEVLDIFTADGSMLVNVDAFVRGAEKVICSSLGSGVDIRQSLASS